ncbi:helix-turn-helix transcriptional regulator [Hymenobacter sp. AT01-02]|uniref:helix-turn-helix transcriptional regulator n=1 Tax=Hymenobacter sp. AT01-02 TaxID=1571877 RepID=UPI0005F19648|nr:YafY family protein [Hymenobacter sp. AT01-02]
MNRFDRIVAILMQLQTRRVVSGPSLAAQFEVSVRTIYRDIRTLELAGVPLFGEPKVGYSLAEGYRLPPVMFTREEAAALLTAEKLAAHLTDAPTAKLSGAAMDKLRAVLRRTDRDYLNSLTPHIQVVRHTGQPAESSTYQQLVAAVATQQVVHIHYQALATEPATPRVIEPIGLYLTQYWHVVGYCRLRQAFRNFRLDRIQRLTLGTEFFAPRPETLQQYWAERASQWQREKVVVRLQLSDTPMNLTQRLHDTKRQYGWAHEQQLPDGSVEMTLYLGSLPYLAAWLLPYGKAVTVVEPPALSLHLRELAQQVQNFFCGPSAMLT